MNWSRVQSDMAKQGYVASDDLSMALHIALSLGRPLLLEGAAGVGKTDIGNCVQGCMYKCQVVLGFISAIDLRYGHQIRSNLC